MTKVITRRIEVGTKGFTDVVDLTATVRRLVAESGLTAGSVMVFVPGSTASITTVEYEPGLVEDLPAALEKIAPVDGPYAHNATWGDGNGSAHVRAAILGAHFTAPFVDGDVVLGTWQQIVLVDFDTRPRRRSLVVQVTGVTEGECES
jgi:secondary thiamine-phosphate synthase enzyme